MLVGNLYWTKFIAYMGATGVGNEFSEHFIIVDLIIFTCALDDDVPRDGGGAPHGDDGDAPPLHNAGDGVGMKLH